MVKNENKLKEKASSCFGRVFAACFVLGRSKLEDPSTEQAEETTKTIGLFLANLIYLNVILWLDKGDFPKNVHTVCPC